MSAAGTDDDRTAAKPMRLRFAGTCRTCGTALASGTSAIYERGTKTVRCTACPTAPANDVTPPASTRIPAAEAPPELAADQRAQVAAGKAGASAEREYARRKAKREDRIRAAHPRLGGLILAISDEPQSTTAWTRGARGEELLGKRLDGLAGHGVWTLHDRRIPRTNANIDHIAIGAAGAFVIDAKRYKGRPERRLEGGLTRARVEKLVVAGRDRTSLVKGVHKQVDLVRQALLAAGLAQVPVRGVLCFVEADWPLIGGAFVIDGVDVLWPRKLAHNLVEAGSLGSSTTVLVHQVLAAAFPSA